MPSERERLVAAARDNDDWLGSALARVIDLERDLRVARAEVVRCQKIANLTANALAAYDKEHPDATD